MPTWLEKDIAAEHPRVALTADCGICRSIATANGINPCHPKRPHRLPGSSNATPPGSVPAVKNPLLHADGP